MYFILITDRQTYFANSECELARYDKPSCSSVNLQLKPSAGFNALLLTKGFIYLNLFKVVVLMLNERPLKLQHNEMADSVEIILLNCPEICQHRSLLY